MRWQNSLCEFTDKDIPCVLLIRTAQTVSRIPGGRLILKGPQLQYLTTIRLSKSLIAILLFPEIDELLTVLLQWPRACVIREFLVNLPPTSEVAPDTKVNRANQTKPHQSTRIISYFFCFSTLGNVLMSPQVQGWQQQHIVWTLKQLNGSVF